MFFSRVTAWDSSLKSMPLDLSSCIWSAMVYAGLFDIAIKKNDPPAVLMVCKTGTVGTKVLLFINIQSFFYIFFFLNISVNEIKYLFFISVFRTLRVHTFIDYLFNFKKLYSLF